MHNLAATLVSKNKKRLETKLHMYNTVGDLARSIISQETTNHALFVAYYPK